VNLSYLSVNLSELADRQSRVWRDARLLSLSRVGPAAAAAAAAAVRLARAI